MSLLSFNFFMVNIIHEMLVLLKNNLNYVRNSIFKCFLRSIKDFYLFFFLLLFSQHLMMKRLSLEEENIIKDIRNLFKLKKELSYTAVKDIKSFST